MNQGRLRRAFAAASRRPAGRDHLLAAIAPPRPRAATVEARVLLRYPMVICKKHEHRRTSSRPLIACFEPET